MNLISQNFGISNCEQFFPLSENVHGSNDQINEFKH